MIVATGQLGIPVLPEWPGQGQPTARPGLFFAGYAHSLRGHLFEANRTSRRLGRTVAEYLQGS